MPTTSPDVRADDPESQSLLDEARAGSLEQAFDADGRLVNLSEVGQLGAFEEYAVYRPDVSPTRLDSREGVSAALRRRAMTTVRAALLAGYSFTVRWGGIEEIPDPEGEDRLCLRSSTLLTPLG